MPNVSNDLDPVFDSEIDADVVHHEISRVSGSGYAHIDDDYGHHLVAWVPLENKSLLRSTSYNQNEKRRTQSYVQTDGAINIGTEEWSGKRIVVLVLDQMKD